MTRGDYPSSTRGSELGNKNDGGKLRVTIIQYKDGTYNKKVIKGQ